MNTRNSLATSLLLLVAGSFLLQSGAIAQTEIISRGSAWEWYNSTTGTDPATTDPDFHTTWNTIGYSGNAFTASGSAPYGYGGIDFAGGNEFNIGTPPSNSRFTAYFRKTFNLTTDFDTLIMNVWRDDGIVIYIDGQEVGRENFTTIDTYTAFAAGTGDETTFFPIQLNINQLSQGQHVIAASVHQASGTSSDLGFDLQLVGTPDTPGQTGEIITFTDQWDWLHPLDGIDPAIADTDFNTTWYDYTSYDGPEFNQTQDNGPGIYGYGGLSWVSSGGIDLGQDIVRPAPGPFAYTAYFKKEFTMEDPANELEMEIFADDGVFVYLNGTQIAKENVTPPDEFLLLADTGGDESGPLPINISISELASGTHVMAVSLHNDSNTSSDQGFAMKFSGNILIGGNTDSDGDGMTDLAENTAGTDPDDPSSVLKIDEITIDEFGCATVNFDGIAGKSYDLEYIFPNGNTAVINFPPHVPDTNGPTEVTGFFLFGPNLPARGFFRLVVPAP